MAEGLARKGFDIDLREGFEAENLVRSLLGDKAKLEVKWDHKTLCTGNVFIEYSSPSGPSGIATTESDWWVTVICGCLDGKLPCYPFHIEFTPTERMRLLARKAYQMGLAVPGGDYNRYPGARVPVRWLTQPPEPQGDTVTPNQPELFDGA